ncbi:MAG TPA: ABC transporter substrate-binding protein [Beijerinckiaceae bacterium]|nr:ABC transporter substrate-binding protein [Beijerinckiaceae bacterium]
MIEPRFSPTLCRLVAAAASLVCLHGSASALTNHEIATYNGADRQKVLEDGARKEGKVVLYSTSGAEAVLVPWKAAFEKKYPFLTLDYWRAGPETVTKAMSEFQANTHTGDVTEWGEGTLAMKNAKALEAFYSPEIAKYAADAKDPDGFWAASRVSYFGTGYNSDLVKPQDVPKTYADLADPRYKGKMAWKLTTGTGARLFTTAMRKLMGEDGADAFMKKLAAQNIANYSGSAVALVDQVARGEYPLALQIFAQDPLRLKAKGAPSDTIMMDPTIGTLGTVQMLTGAPHPYATMLFIDFVLSKEGQDIVQKAGYFSANPDSPPVDAFRSIVPNLIHMKIYMAGPEEAFAEEDKSQKILDKYFSY